MNIFKKYKPWILKQDACFFESQYVSNQTELSTEFFCGIVEKKVTLGNLDDNYNVCAR